DNFSRDRMAGYLDLKPIYKKTKRVDWMPEELFPSQRIFCMVGTNRSDYEVAAGLSRTFAGNGSDGLVRVANASVWGVNAKGVFSEPSATAYAYRSHSGFFGIVNSEEAYQNLVRFLFGDVRVDLWFDVDQVALPPDIPKDADVDAPACRTHKELMDAANPDNKSIYLSTVFLSNRAKVDPSRRTLAYAMT